MSKGDNGGSNQGGSDRGTQYNKNLPEHPSKIETQRKQRKAAPTKPEDLNKDIPKK